MDTARNEQHEEQHDSMHANMTHERYERDTWQQTQTNFFVGTHAMYQTTRQ